VHDDFVEVGGKFAEGEFAGAQVIAERDDVMPGFPGELR
jgi:hypothetical protein